MVYVGALSALDFLLRQIIEAKDAWHQSGIEDKIMPFPAWGIIPLGYALFAWAAAYWFFLLLVSPDVLLAAFFFLAAGAGISHPRPPRRNIRSLPPPHRPPRGVFAPTT